MIDGGKVDILGIGIDVVDYEAAVHRIITAAHDQRAYGVSALAVHGVMTGADDPEHAARLNQLDLVTPDGQPVRWAMNLLHGAGLRDRVYGPKLTLLVCQAAAHDGLPVYFYGSNDEVLAHLAATPGVELSVRIEIEATAAAGFDEGRVRTVSENAHTLRFEAAGFEDS